MPWPSQEDLLKIWFDSKPTAKSPYAINGNPPMWETLKDGDLTLFTAPAKVQTKTFSHGPYDKVENGLMYMWQRDGRWVGQGCTSEFAYFTKEGPSKIEIPPAPEAAAAPAPK